jgi:transcriptional regulator
MYQPDHFRTDDIAIMHALMRAHPFAALISHGTGGLFATHLPTVLVAEGSHGVVECHLARANPHWKDLAAGEEALMLFSGTQGYITPNWYATKAETQKVVPTWNYAVVHAYGRPRMIQDKDWLRAHVAQLTDQQERTEPRPWALSDAPDSYVEVMLRGIVGFRFEIGRLEGKWKMSQNREEKDRAGVIGGLAKRGAPGDAEIAGLVASPPTAKG